MTGTRLANVRRNGLLAAEAPGTMQRRPNRRRSASLTISDGSDLSRITLVEIDPELAADDSSKSDDSYEIISYEPPKYTWVHHLRGVFCLSLPKKEAIMRKQYRRPKTPVGSVRGQGFSTWPSPWILPVYVYPNQGDKGSETVPQIGKCTIDTGNLQGNIVSREFVERVLEYPPKRFRKLTKEEERGGTGITGDLHVPEGAIYLTWYHKNSTRVFRDMRFLISPSSDCDLIIGARSIQKDGILNVPCLMADSYSSGNKTRLRDTSQDPLHDTFYSHMETQNDSLQGKRNEIRAKLKKDLRGALPGLITEYASLMVDFDFYHNADDLYNVLHNKDLPNEEKMTLAEPYWNKLSELKNRVGPELESSDLSDKKDQILEGIKTNAPKDAKEFQEVWQNLADMYALSNGLQVKLEPDGELRAFWDKLKGEYYSYPIR